MSTDAKKCKRAELMKWINRHVGAILPFLLFLAIVLALLHVKRYNNLSIDFFKSHKDSLSGLQSSATVIAIVIGGFLAYFKYFFNRVFVRRANVMLKVSVLPADLMTHQHFVSFSVENKGPLSLRDMKFRVVAVDFVCGTPKESVDLSDLIKTPSIDPGMEQVIDSGEMAQLHLVRQVATMVSSVEYIASVRDRVGNQWYASTVISNILTEKKS